MLLRDLTDRSLLASEPLSEALLSESDIMSLKIYHTLQIFSTCKSIIRGVEIFDTRWLSTRQLYEFKLLFFSVIYTPDIGKIFQNLVHTSMYEFGKKLFCLFTDIHGINEIKTLSSTNHLFERFRVCIQ